MHYPPLACCLGFIGKESCSRTADVCEKGSQWQQTLDLFDRLLGKSTQSNTLTYIAANSACGEGWPCDNIAAFDCKRQYMDLSQAAQTAFDRVLGSVAELDMRRMNQILSELS